MACLGSIASAQLSLSVTEVKLDQYVLRREDHAVIVAAHRDHNGPILVWLGENNPAALPDLARKLPHYGSYSYLAFQGNEPTNIVKGQWQVLDSPLNVAVSKRIMLRLRTNRLSFRRAQH